MKEKNIFNKIYQKDLNLQFKNLKKVEVGKNTRQVKKEAEVNDIKETSDETLDAFLDLFYNNRDPEEVKIPTEFEKKVLTEKVLRNRIKAENIRESLQELESEILNEVKNKTFTLDISKSTNYKKASNDIFGGNKRRISFDDYLHLLELKEKIIMHEASDILGS
jgi:hypothetical protein